MARKIVKYPQANIDLANLADFISRDSLDAAERFLDAAESAFNLLSEESELGTRCQFSRVGLGDMRMWTIRGFASHVIFYRPIEDGIEVVRVIHASRNIDSIFG